MASLPLKARVTIRDLWDKPEAPAHVALNKVKEILGIDVHCVPQWTILISELERAYEDRAQLVGFVVGSLQVWFETLAELLEDTSLDPWSDTLLSRIQEVSHRLNLEVEVSDGDSASTHFSKTHRGFVVTLPNVAVNPPTQFANAFKDQILDSAEERSSHKAPPTMIGGGGWSYVESDLATEASYRPAQTAPLAAVGGPEVRYLPDAEALPKPATLMLRPPYHLIVKAPATNHIEIECSHTPTLDVMYNYLKRWCRVNPNLVTKPPVMSIEHNLSTCSFGLTYDTLIVSSQKLSGNYFTVSPTLIMTLVEGSLGYRLTYNDASTWHYRKDTPFRTT